jgi:hypothetical protein
MKYFSSTFSSLVCGSLASSPVELPPIPLGPPLDCMDSGPCESTGPVGGLADESVLPLRNRQTSLTPWNLESWNLDIAAAQLDSVL